MKDKPIKLFGQLLFYVVFAGAVGYFSAAPAYRHFDSGQALIKMTMTHGGEYKGGCRKRTAQELQDIAPNMRRQFDCPRDRVPVVVELDVDGEPVYQASLPPSGLHGDGPASMYEALVVPAGSHRIDVRMRDTERDSGFDYESSASFTFRPRQLLVIQFRQESGGFTFTE